LQGARAVQLAILENNLQGLSASILWIPMLPLDNALTAKLMAAKMRHPSVTQFYDPRKIAGRAIAQSLGGQGKAAWDIYLFYSKGVEWIDNPPQPYQWAHQLIASSWANPANYYTGNDLIEELRKMAELTIL